VLTGTASSLLAAKFALMVFGVGLGTFTSLNNSSTMAAAPDECRGEVGGPLNLMRVLGTRVGVACGSAVLSWPS
jgi:hypothetical protein